MTKTELNSKLKELGYGSLRINSKIYRTRLNKMVKGIGLYAVGPYTINEMQHDRFDSLVKKVLQEVNGHIEDKMSGYARIYDASCEREIVMTLQSVNVGEYVHYYASINVK